MTTGNRMTIHPGRVLLDNFLEPMGISQSRLASDIGVPLQRITEIVRGTRSISADIAHRLAHYFGMSERFWLTLQAQYDGKREVTLLRSFQRSSRYDTPDNRGGVYDRTRKNAHTN
jgi:addiction module HigA family antidote